jgi:hypothetical protein
VVQRIISNVDAHNTVKTAATTSEEIRKIFRDNERLEGMKLVSGPVVTEIAHA